MPLEVISAEFRPVRMSKTLLVATGVNAELRSLHGSVGRIGRMAKRAISMHMELAYDAR